jgi:hypothetical protein
MPVSRLVHANGEDLDVHRFAVPDSKVGDTIPLGGGTLRVVDVVWHDENDDVEATLMVEVADF